MMMHGAAAPAHAVVDVQLGRRIERAGRLVQHHHRRLADQRARDLEPLALAAAEVAAAFLDQRLIAALARLDHLVDRGVAAGRADALSGHRRSHIVTFSATVPPKRNTS